MILPPLPIRTRPVATLYLPGIPGMEWREPEHRKVGEMDDKTGIRVGLGRAAGGEAKLLLYRKLPWGSELHREKLQPQEGGKEPGARPTAGARNGSRAMLVWDGVGTWPLAVGGIFNKQCSKPASPGTFTQSRL